MLWKDREHSDLQYGGSAGRHQYKLIRTTLLQMGYGCVLRPPTWILPAAQCLSIPPCPFRPIPGGTNINLEGINNLGQMVGWYDDPSGNEVGFFAPSAAAFSTTPEPSSLVLASVGLLTLLGYAWRRRRP
jgi:MYXO-CTERM domain-containing protein